jgi:hypothetical protein
MKEPDFTYIFIIIISVTFFLFLIVSISVFVSYFSRQYINRLTSLYEKLLRLDIVIKKTLDKCPSTHYHRLVRLYTDIGSEESEIRNRIHKNCNIFNLLSLKRKTFNHEMQMIEIDRRWNLLKQEVNKPVGQRFIPELDPYGEENWEG